MPRTIRRRRPVITTEAQCHAVDAQLAAIDAAERDAIDRTVQAELASERAARPISEEWQRAYDRAQAMWADPEEGVEYCEEVPVDPGNQPIPERPSQDSVSASHIDALNRAAERVSAFTRVPAAALVDEDLPRSTLATLVREWSRATEAMASRPMPPTVLTSRSRLSTQQLEFIMDMVRMCLDTYADVSDGKKVDDPVWQMLTSIRKTLDHMGY